MPPLAHDRDDSVSPMTMNPLPNSPTPKGLDQLYPSPLASSSSSAAPARSVRVRDLPISPLQIAEITEQLRREDERNGTGGDQIPENHTPWHGFTQTPPRSPSLAPQPSPKRNHVARVPDRDEYIPDEPGTPGRRSVQFVGADTVLELPRLPHSRQSSWDDADPMSRSRGERWMSKLKSTLSTTTTVQPPRALGLTEQAGPSAGSSPVMSRSYHLPDTLSEEPGSDADVEESGDEAQPREDQKMKKRKRMKRRLKQLDVFTTPTTLRHAQDDIGSPGMGGRFHTLVRRSTMPDSSEHRGGLSEGEGRDRLTRRRPGWRRGSSWMGAQQQNGNATADEGETLPVRGPGHRRRISDMMFGAGNASDGEALSAPRRPFLISERAATFGVPGWNRIKQTVRMFGKRRPDQIDFHKSAELMAELRAVTPAVMLLASMLQRDEHGNKRIPVLLEQLNIRVIDSRPEDSTSERHSLFTISLEYGSGPSRMTWTVTRGIREIWNMHWKYRLTLKNDRPIQAGPNQHRRPRQPAFPRKAFPYLRSYQNRDESDEEDKANGPRADDTAAEGTAGEGTVAEATVSDAERRPTTGRKKSRVNNFLPRRQSSGLGEGREGSSLNPQNAAAVQKRFIEKQRKTLEKYLQDMVRWLMFRPDSNRLCKFLELSALGVRLAAEGNFHGKECYLHIQSAKGIDFRRVLTPQKVIARHSRKWFLVRQNYIAVVESPSSMNIYDVYLVDPHFHVVAKKNKFHLFGRKITGASEKADDEENGRSTDDDTSHKHHSLKIYTTERKIKLFSRNPTILKQFELSVNDMLKQTKWHEPHRFGSFAPVRQNAFAQWLVDGRDYMWNVSRAISMAQDVIYIHDWWLSPELYMRRPACTSQKWRLDRLLQRKAREGVKIFVIVYRNVEQAIPIDSEYTKFSLLNLHDNIMVLRSPNQLKKNQFFYAHHEKICIVDHDVAFLGGIDLCFGRWDNPQHPIDDSGPTGWEANFEGPKDAEHCQLFPGKDYSNPRVLDFCKLNEPYAELYDRNKTPRMPWHDISMQVAGQPARDLTRHFVQRWNYLRRERKPTRPTPFLLPPPDAQEGDLAHFGLSGTCEVQMLRSAGDWSLGFPKDVREHSIQTAYVKMIEESEHFVYMENQFFITSTETLNIKVVNRIGDALVERITRAHANDEEWRCCVLIPLMPGFQNTVDQADGSSVRLIMQFQYRSICRGPHSIFGRLRERGINPEAYISFFSLRNWGHLGKRKTLTTEQLYIHAKTIIVDDRIALIGSANINERSMQGNRDSETAAVVRDTDMIWSTMAGEPYRVGRFAHTLRMRLMREHLGLDVDAITEEDIRHNEAMQFENDMKRIYGDDDDEGNDGHNGNDDKDDRYDHRAAESSAHGPSSLRPGRPTSHHARSFNHDAKDDTGDIRPSSPKSIRSLHSVLSHASKGKSSKPIQGHDSKAKDVEGHGADHWKEAQEKGEDLASDSAVINGREVLLYPSPNLLEYAAKAKNSQESKRVSVTDVSARPSSGHGSHAHLGESAHSGSQHLTVPDSSVTAGPSTQTDDSREPSVDAPNPLLEDIQQAKIDKDCMRDPVSPAFWDDVWSRVARNNTVLYRRVFRCMPDSEVKTWKEYGDFVQYADKFAEAMYGPTSDDEKAEGEKPSTPSVGAAAAGIAAPATAPLGLGVLERLQAEKDHIEHEAEAKTAAVSGAIEHLNEKLPIPHVDEGANAEQAEGTHLESERLDEKADVKQSLDTPSMHPTEEVPFPAIEERPAANGQGTHLATPDNNKRHDRRATFSTSEKSAPDTNSNASCLLNSQSSVRRRKRTATKGSRRGYNFPYDVLTREDAELCCSKIQGHLVQFPYDWLQEEEKDNHWLYQADLLAPKEI
ncbi:phospholipase D [Xylariaceae sp. FL0594]|nr:phospholipase D [Xylariaceae sp. FL0594]